MTDGGSAAALLFPLPEPPAIGIPVAVSALGALDCPNEVTGYLMCTDNMPSGSAVKMGDVLTVRGGTTVEVQNTDAEAGW